MNNYFSNNLKKIRKDHNLSQEQLADELGVSRQAISKWESAVAYPEMDKIIALCSMFELNIDDLLNKDIREVKGEEETKKTLNKYINDFLGFITDVVNLFSSMSFKSRIKCLFEQVFLSIVLLLVFLVASYTFESLVHNLFVFLPDSVGIFICNFFSIIFDLLCFIISVVILIHLFKIRYLNYYNDYRQCLDEKKNDVNSNDNEKKAVNEKQSKIIIRDPKNSEYRFINGLFKVIIILFKFFLMCFAFVLAIILVCLFITFIFSFLIYKTGIFFIGLLISILSLLVIVSIILLATINFVFNRKNDKKKMIWSFFVSLIVFGVGCGLLFVGFLNFNVIGDSEISQKIVLREHDMKDDMIVYPFAYPNVEFVESDNSNIKVEYSVSKYCDVEESNFHKNSIEAWSVCNNPTKIMRDLIDDINDYKILSINNGIGKVKVYTTKANIEKLKINRDNYFLDKEQKDEIINSYIDKINDLNSLNEKLTRENNDLRNRLED